MKFNCSGIDLNDAVLKVIKATSFKTPQTALEGIKLVATGDSLILTATDLEIAIEKKIVANILVEGECLVPGKLFSEYVKKLTDEEVEIELIENNQLKIIYGENIGFLACYNIKEFPEFKKLTDGTKFNIKSKELQSLIDCSVICTATDDSRPIFKGVLFEAEGNNIRAVAIDGFRLAVVNRKISNLTANLKAVIPARCLNEIEKLLTDNNEDVEITLKNNYLMVNLHTVVILTRLLDGEFFNYNKIIPASQPSHLIINKKQLEVALERASLLTRVDKNNIVKFKIEDKILTILSHSETGEIKEKVLINSNCPDITIGFNAKNLLDILKVITDEFIIIKFDTKIDPVIIKQENDSDYLYLVLPVRYVS